MKKNETKKKRSKLKIVQRVLVYASLIAIIASVFLSLTQVIQQ